MKSIGLVLMALLALAPEAALGARKAVEETMESAGRPRTYFLFVPDGLAEDRPAPLLVTLHGSGRNGLSLVEKWTRLAAEEGFVVVGPDSWDERIWSSPADGPEFLRDLVERMKARFDIDPRRVYLFGHSAGAGFALQMTMVESEYFAATAVHAGNLHPSSYHLMDYAKRMVPIYIAVGTRDRYYPLEKVRETRDVLTARGFPVEMIEIKGHDHWYYDRAPKINRGVWEFLRRHALEGEPHYEQYRFE